MVLIPSNGFLVAVLPPCRALLSEANSGATVPRAECLGQFHSDLGLTAWNSPGSSLEITHLIFHVVSSDLIENHQQALCNLLRRAAYRKNDTIVPLP
jgi:hypothetical protein